MRCFSKTFVQRCVTLYFRSVYQYPNTFLQVSFWLVIFERCFLLSVIFSEILAKNQYYIGKVFIICKRKNTFGKLVKMKFSNVLLLPDHCEMSMTLFYVKTKDARVWISTTLYLTFKSFVSFIVLKNIFEFFILVVKYKFQFFPNNTFFHDIILLVFRLST